MTYWFEKDAKNNAPMPDGMTEHEALIYSFLRNLYWSLQRGLITSEQAQHEKDVTLKKMEKGREAREFERRLWENSAKRTMVAERAMTMYRKNRTLENADIMYDSLEWLHDECSMNVIITEHGANCPICGAFFNQEHADRRPAYCETCGCRLDWSRQKMNTEQCKGCVYWNSANGMKTVDHFCHYLLVNGKMRPREGEKCLGRKDLATRSGRRMSGEMK